MITDEQLAEWKRLAGQLIDWSADDRTWALTTHDAAKSHAAIMGLVAEVERLRAVEQELTSEVGRLRGQVLVATLLPWDVESVCTAANVATTALRNPKSACACAPPPARHLPDCPHFTEGA